MVEDPSVTLEALILRSQQGDDEAFSEMGKFLDNHPSIWQIVGNLAVQAEQKWIRLHSGDNPAVGLMLGRKLEAMKRDLRGPNATPTIRLLAERVAVDWLQLYHADLHLASLQSQQGVTGRQLEVATRRQQMLARGFQRAIAMLETVRRLAPSVPMPMIPDGGGTPQALADPSTPEPGRSVLSIASRTPEPARRVAAQAPPESPAPPRRRVR